MTSDPQLTVSLSGILFSGGASFAGVLLAQRLIAGREEHAVQRRRDRVRALFVGMVQNAASYFLFQVQSETVILDSSSFEKALAPLRQLASDTTLVLDLEPGMITALYKAIHVAGEELELFEIAMREEEPMDVDPEAFFRYRREKVGILLRDTAAAFRELVAAFGITRVTAPELIRAIPEIPSSRSDI